MDAKQADNTREAIAVMTAWVHGGPPAVNEQLGRAVTTLDEAVDVIAGMTNLCGLLLNLRLKDLDDGTGKVGPLPEQTLQHIATLPWNAGDL